MSREIKFRAWDNVNSNMEFNIHQLDSLNEILHKEKYNVMQFTGLHDKNGKEIYEGDIVRYLHKYKPDPIYAEVRWFNQHANFALYENTYRNIYDHESDWMILKDIEVIGNIYQKPELLTTK